MKLTNVPEPEIHETPQFIKHFDDFILREGQFKPMDKIQKTYINELIKAVEQKNNETSQLIENLKGALKATYDSEQGKETPGTVDAVVGVGEELAAEETI